MKEEAIKVNNLGVQHFMRQEWEAATKKFLEAHELDPTNGSVLNNLGLLFHQKKEFETAVGYFNQALALEEKETYLVNRGNAFAMMGKYDNAHQDYAMALRKNNHHEEAWVSLAKLMSYTGNFREAENSYRQLLRKFPKTQYWIDFSSLLVSGKKFKEALEILYSLVEENDIPTIWFQIGRCEFFLKNHGLAETAFKKALADQPDQKEYRHFLALNYLAMGQMEEGIHHLDLLLKLYPEDHELLTEKGVVLCGIKDFKGAHQHFERALQIKPDYEKALLYREKIANNII